MSSKTVFWQTDNRLTPQMVSLSYDYRKYDAIIDAVGETIMEAWIQFPMKCVGPFYCEWEEIHCKLWRIYRYAVLSLVR